MSIDRIQTQYEIPDAVDWNATEAARLTDMDKLVQPYTQKDLIDILRTRRGATALDVAAGPGTTVQKLCEMGGVTYVSLDINKEILAKRTNPFNVMGSKYELPFPDKFVDISFSRASTAWGNDARGAIEEQLRVTRDVAVFSEFDWSQARPGDEMPPEDAELLVSIKDTLQGTLASIGFEPLYGNRQLGEDIREVVRSGNIACEIEEISHHFPPNDYRAYLCKAAEGLIPYASQEFADNVETYRSLPTANFVIPSLITQRVTMHHS